MKKLLRFNITLCMLLLMQFAIGQNSVSKANELLNKYLKQARFDKEISIEMEKNFNTLFAPEALVTFDIPFIDTEIQNAQIKRISKDDRQQFPMINVYGKMMTVNMYTEIMKREMNNFDLNSLDYTLRFTGKMDISKVKTDTIVFEVEKKFKKTYWSQSGNEVLLVSIKFTNGEPIIYNIRSNEEKISAVDLTFILVDLSSNNKDPIPGVVANFLIKYEDGINNRLITGKSDLAGQISLPKSAGKRSSVLLDSVNDPNGIRYNIPNEWRADGKEVSEQPIDGFIIGLSPYIWNGLSYSVFLTGGVFSPEKMRTANFITPSNFTSNTGIKTNAGFNLAYFVNHKKIKFDRTKWLWGFGSGIQLEYQQSTTTSDDFDQNQYDFIDNGGELCKVQFMGNTFSETNSLFNLTVPLFFELRKYAGKKFSFSFKAGANFSLPISSSYDANGTFSRWGYYGYNDYSQPIEDDQKLNYFTDKDITYSGELEYNPLLAEGFLKINGLLHVFKKNPDNSLEIGLIFSMPFTPNTSYNYEPGNAQSYEGYWINTENDEYHSLACSTEKIYQYYFGISIGINLIKYRPR